MQTTTEKNISFTRPEYTKLLPKWQLVRDCCLGEQDIKAAGDKYLPRPNPTDTTEQNKRRYEQYVARAVFVNATKHTLSGMTGTVMAVDPAIELPKVIEPLKDNADGSGVTLQQLSTKALEHVIKYGRAGLWVDYPAVDEATVQQQVAGEVRPFVLLVDNLDIINWRTSVINGVVKLSLVVIQEQYVKTDDGFERSYDDQWRVLYLDDAGFYCVDEWIRDVEAEKAASAGNAVPVRRYKLRSSQNLPHHFEPKDSAGNRLDYIPFVFIGADNNDSVPAQPPLYDLASLNIAHYRNSADYEEACYIVGQPTPYLSGLTEDWVKDVLKGRVELGSRAAIMLPENGTAGLIQANPNSMPKEAMESKEKQMVALGAKLVEQKQVQRTATEAGYDRANEVSVLAQIANNVSSAFQQALKYAANFLDVSLSDEIKFKLNTDFVFASSDATQIQAIVAAWQSNAITWEEMRRKLKRSNVAFEDDEQAKEKISEEMKQTQADIGLDNQNSVPDLNNQQPHQ